MFFPDLISHLQGEIYVCKVCFLLNTRDTLIEVFDKDGLLSQAEILLCCRTNKQTN